ncbi:MAG: N-acetylmuramoyl-L-alanine amidase [Deltaproteobacteria bacterium]|nr:N-acetylmuramoyl-L-alanine amidase [Deltaproteobacteria bacterium]
MLAALSLVLSTATLSLPVVAIDPGHGGEQPGAYGTCGVSEKDVARGIARHLAAFLEASGRVQPFLTRGNDETLSLEERARLARERRALLLLSIHANASDNPESRGVETYFLSKSAADRRVAKLARAENDGRLLRHGGGDAALAKILGGLLLQAAAVESRRLGVRIQEAMQTVMGKSGRGLLQAPFIVLKEASMPAVLVEVGFLTNADDCALLETDLTRAGIARALTSAILEHLANDSGAARQ